MRNDMEGSPVPEDEDGDTAQGAGAGANPGGAGASSDAAGAGAGANPAGAGAGVNAGGAGAGTNAAAGGAGIPGNGGTATGGGTRTLSLDEPPERILDLDEESGSVGVGSGTFLQRSGVKLFRWVLTLTALAVLALFISLYAELSQTPQTPGAGALTAAFQRGDTLQAQRLAAHYRAVSDVVVAQRDSAWAHFVMGVKELIVTVFFPLLTGILGYIFGTRSEAAQAGGDQDSGDA